MIPMCIATPFSKHPQLRSHKGLPRRSEGTSASLEQSHARDVRVSGRTQRLGRTAEPGDTAVGSRPQPRWCERGSDKQWKGCIYLARPRNIYRTPLAQNGRSRYVRIRCEGSCGVLRQAQARKQHSALRSASSAFQKMSGAPRANFAREQITLQLKPHR